MADDEAGDEADDERRRRQRRPYGAGSRRIGRTVVLGLAAIAVLAGALVIAVFLAGDRGADVAVPGTVTGTAAPEAEAEAGAPGE